MKYPTSRVYFEPLILWSIWSRVSLAETSLLLLRHYDNSTVTKT